MWANITHPNHRHHLHIHPNCLLSGILWRAPAGEHGHADVNEDRIVLAFNIMMRGKIERPTARLDLK